MYISSCATTYLFSPFRVDAALLSRLRWPLLEAGVGRRGSHGGPGVQGQPGVQIRQGAGKPDRCLGHGFSIPDSILINVRERVVKLEANLSKATSFSSLPMFCALCFFFINKRLRIRLHDPRALFVGTYVMVFFSTYVLLGECVEKVQQSLTQVRALQKSTPRAIWLFCVGRKFIILSWFSVSPDFGSLRRIVRKKNLWDK